MEKFNRYKGVHLTDVDRKYIVENAQKMTRSELAEKIGCTTQTIYTYCKKLGVKCKPKERCNAWSERELMILANTYGRIPTIELAKIMGRTKATICDRVSQLRRNGVEVPRVRR